MKQIVFTSLLIFAVTGFAGPYPDFKCGNQDGVQLDIHAQSEKALVTITGQDLNYAGTADVEYISSSIYDQFIYSLDKAVFGQDAELVVSEKTFCGRAGCFPTRSPLKAKLFLNGLDIPLQCAKL